MRLIDAEKLDFGKVFVGSSEFASDCRESAKTIIDSAPTVDAEPVRHGHWNTRDTTKGGYEYLACECGKRHTVRKPYTTTVNTCSICGWSEWVSVSPYKYCPNCGAKMDAERKG